MVLMDLLIRRCARMIPEEVKALARAEGMEPAKIARGIAAGRIVIPSNPKRTHVLSAVGEGCLVKINVNIGTSGSRCDPALEMEKGKAALANGADALMDLSTGGDLVAIRKNILSLDTTVGTVPVYEAVRRAGNAIDVDADLLFRVIREHCEQGVDFLTLHCGVNLQALAALKSDPRMMGVVSRGGSFHCAMMMKREEENPLYAEFDYLMEILAEHDVTVSLGDGMRPGCLQDAEKLAKSVEYMTLGALAQRAHEKGVQRMIEGPGHMPLDQVGYNVRMIKEITDHAPLYLLGPTCHRYCPGLRSCGRGNRRGDCLPERRGFPLHGFAKRAPCPPGRCRHHRGDPGCKDCRPYRGHHPPPGRIPDGPRGADGGCPAPAGLG